jgi:hypothetical protein
MICEMMIRNKLLFIINYTQIFFILYNKTINLLKDVFYIKGY